MTVRHHYALSNKGGNVMTVSKQTTGNKCCFYASDFHLEMTIVPYINNKIEENKNVIIVTENNLSETIKMLISRMNIKNKNKILELDWNNTELQQAKGKKDLVIIINGSKKFIQGQNKKIKEMFEEENVEVIDCYCFDEIKEEIVGIREKYTSVLNKLQKAY